MKKKDRLYSAFAKIAPSGYRRLFSKNLRYSGYDFEADNLLGTVNILALLVFSAISLFPWAFYRNFSLLYFFFGIASAFAVEMTAYLIIYFKVEERKQRIESVLPDMLYLASANLKSGMSPYEAIRMSAIKEFGPLKEEIDKAISKVYGATSFSEALLDINKRVNSETLERVLRLFTTAIKSGGHMAPLLEELANDISQNRELKNEMFTSTKTYTIFIMFIVILVAPLLMAVSVHFFDVVSSIQEKTNSSSDVYGLGFFSGEMALTSEFLVKIAVVMLMATGILASMMIGAIKEGKAKYGLKYAMFISLSSVAFFFIIRKVAVGFI